MQTKQNLKAHAWNCVRIITFFLNRNNSLRVKTKEDMLGSSKYFIASKFGSILYNKIPQMISWNERLTVNIRAWMLINVICGKQEDFTL